MMMIIVLIMMILIILIIIMIKIIKIMKMKIQIQRKIDLINLMINKINKLIVVNIVETKN